MVRKALGVEPDVAVAWYVLVTSASRKSAFATMGPYATEEDAKHAADDARVVHYRIAASSFDRGRST